jgi:hypothetical protein
MNDFVLNQYFFVHIFMANSKNVVPAPVFTGINSSGNPEAFDITGLPPARE